ncbi:unnamed protein product [Aphanomyces euteiches]
MIIDAVVHQHASPNTVLHLLYIYYYKNIAKVRLAELFHKDPSTVANWIKRMRLNANFIKLLQSQQYGKQSMISE